MITYSEFIQYAMREQQANPEWRMGQTLVNCLYTIRPGMYADILNTDADCFYSNEKMDNFFAYVRKYWSL